MRFPFVLMALLLIVSLALPAAADDPAPTGQQFRDVPARFFVNYPAAERFCPPIRTAFADAASTILNVRGRREVVHPNGAYGLPLMEVRGQSRFHTGADIGWFRDGEPVYAIADGVVRSSHAGIRAAAAEDGRRLPGGPIDYGNLIIIEHRTPDGEHFCSLYGHLGDDRLVARGDLVTGGQQIGTIGRNAAIVNGGYEPHLHFAIREGAWYEPDDRFMQLQVQGEPTAVRIVELGEQRTRVSLTPDPGIDFTMTVQGERIEMSGEGGVYTLPSDLLYHTAPAGKSFPGYASSLEGWTDPIAFLRRQGAGSNPPSAMHVTSCRDDSFQREYVIGQSAPSWSVAEWHRPVDNPDLDTSDFAGKVVALFCFDPDCRASRTHGLPALLHLASHYNGDPDVSVVALLTPTGRRHPPRREQRELLSQFPPQVSFGYCGRPRTLPALLDDYQICGTPWAVLIDRGGTVQFSNYTVRAEELVRRIDELKAQ